MASFVSLKTLVLTVGLALALATDAAAQKTDVIVLRNGDRITGEIKGLVRGKLEVSTDNLSTVLITWVEVVELRTKRMFVVELITGERTFGTLESHRSGRASTSSGSRHGRSRCLPSSSFTNSARRCSGALTATFRLACTSRDPTTRSSGRSGTVATYEGERWLHSLNLSSTYTSQNDLEPTERTTATLRLPVSSRVAGFTAACCNTSGIRNWTSTTEEALAAGAGRWLLHSNRRALSTLGGVLLVRERL